MPGGEKAAQHIIAHGKFGNALTDGGYDAGAV